MERFLKLGSEKIPNLVGVKHSSPCLNSLMRCNNVCGGRFHVLQGSDDVSESTRRYIYALAETQI